MTHDTLAIVGSYTPTRKLFDFTRNDCDVWVFNEAVNADWCTRADAVFQMHDRIIWSNPANRNDPNHVNWLQNKSASCNVCSGKGCNMCEKGTYTPPPNRLNVTVYMREKNSDVPNSIAYPIDGVLKMVGKDNHFLTSSVSQALALAALKKYKRVEIYGVAMQTQTEYQFQREGVSFWLGYLRGFGIDVVFIGDTFHAPLYGYEGAVSIQYGRFDERIQELVPRMEELSNEYITKRVNLHNATKELEQNGSKTAQDAVMEHAKVMLDIGEQLGTLDGAKQENERYKKKADVMRAQGGDFIFSRQEFESAAHNLKQKADQANMEFVSVATTLAHIERNAMQAAKGSPKREKMFTLYRETIESYLQANNKAAVYKGAMQENYIYMQWLDKHIRAAGGTKSEAVMLEASNAAMV